MTELDTELIAVPLGVELEECTWWLVEMRDEDGWDAVGYMGCKLTDGGKYAYISRMGTLPRAAGKGIQKRLITVAEQWGRRQGCTHLWTYTSWNNVWSMRAFARRGYVPYKAESDNDFHSISFEKKLTR